MPTAYEMVGEFHTTYRCPKRSHPTLDVPEAPLRQKLHDEEYAEVLEAIELGKLAEIGKELADLAYVLLGSGHAYGIYLPPVKPSTYRRSPILTLDSPDSPVLLRLLGRWLEKFSESVAAGQLEDVAKSLQRAVVLTYSVAGSYGIPLDEVFEEVHRSNMSKLDENGNPILNEYGKILKGPNYFEARVSEVLAAYQQAA